ncbi:hypothetical protein Hdeb2414_s0024g00648741 [Helianthus debilis subsp. tardiflorus]
MPESLIPPVNEEMKKKVPVLLRILISGPSYSLRKIYMGKKDVWTIRLEIFVDMQLRFLACADSKG